MIGATYNDAQGTAIYKRKRIQEAKKVDRSCEDEVFLITVEVNGMIIVNVYKPFTTTWLGNIETVGNLPMVYAQDFISHHNLWGYDNNDNNGEKLLEWTEEKNLHFILIYKDKNITGKAARLTECTHEFLVHSGPKTRHWIKDFLSDIMETSVPPSEFKSVKSSPS